MYTVFDYLKYYGDCDIEEIPWNVMDNLICACLAYTPIKSFKGTKTFFEVYSEVKNLKINTNVDYMTAQTKELFSLMNNSKRYKKLKFKNFVDILDDNTQFGAVMFLLDDIKIISFKGTEGSVISWLENFRLSYQYPTYTQKLAIRYLDENISMLDDDVYVLGHSKGGNLAMASAMELNKFKFSKIKQVINFDGPGFRAKEFNSKKYEKLSNKLINIMPDNSVVGTLLFNKNYKIITTNALGVNSHYLTNWNTYGIFLVDGKWSKLSKLLHEEASVSLSKREYSSLRELVEVAFETINLKKTDKIDLGLKEIVKLISKVRTLDQETSQQLFSIVNSILRISRKD